MLRLLSWLVPLLVLAGCGGRTGLGDPSNGGDLGLPLYDQDAGFAEQTCGSTCTLSGTDDQGRTIRFYCDGARCQFFVADVPGFVCTDLDFANVCSNGVPLCVQRSNFNFTRTEFLPCPGR